jgi:hypothetical protein
MNWRNDLGFSKGTILILDISCYFMKRYFGHNDPDSLVSAYFEKYGQYATERYIGHELSWGMATQIYFTMALGGDRSHIRKWERDNGWLDAPPDAVAYLQDHYWNKHRG